MVSRVDGILAASMNDDADDEVSFSIVDTAPANPFLHYTTPADPETAVRGEGSSDKRPKSGKKSTKESRPKSAARNRKA
jgi:hypothetical protein